MSQAKCISLFVVVAVALCLFNGSVMAQNTAPAAPVSCVNATNMQVNGTLIAGDWYEMARNPSTSVSLNCVELSIGLVNATTETYNMSTTYAPNANNLNKNTTFSNLINITDTANPNGFNLTYTIPGASAAPITFKLLATDYNNYAFVCGYATTDNSSFGIVLARNRAINSTTLMNYEMQAAMNYSDFLNGTMSTITQTAACYTAGAATRVPIMAAIFTMIYALLKFMH